MQNGLLFILLVSTFFTSCINAPSTENNKTESVSVNKEIPQPTVTTEKPIDRTTPELNEQNSSPNNPLPPKGEAVVTNSNTPHIATTPQPSPDRTNVSPSKVVAKNTVTNTEPPSTEKNQNPPATRPAIGAADTPDTSQPVVEKSDEIQKAKTSVPPISSDKNDTETKSQYSPPLSHQAWDELLKKYVSTAGKVNYAGLKSEKAKLDGYLKELQNNPPSNDWQRNETMAFWINAYNAFTVKLIVDNYPVSSITKSEGGKPWDKKWITIGDKTYSLNNIENDILRPKYKDARIHFAVNCAAKSCPPLLNNAWTEENLNSNFEKQAKAFINNHDFNRITEKKVQVSKIFEWYASDFGNLIDYLNKYSSVKISGSAKVEYLEYNWNLNN